MEQNNAMPEVPQDVVGRHATDALLQRLPQDVREALAPAQLDALAAALAQPTSPQLVDFRLSVRWLRRRYYTRLLIGHERRSLSRLQQEKQIHLGSAVVLMAAAVWLVVSILLALTVSLLYLAKAAYGFDVFDGDSLLHACFFN
jgi:hypothetical protein